MISLVLPTFNEAANIPELLRRIEGVLRDIPHEIIIVDDDSPDHTWEVAEHLRREYPFLRVIRRKGKKPDLSQAVVEGFSEASGEVLILMDADLQHDPRVILALYEHIQKGADVSIASRYMTGGNVGEWVTGRRYLSNIATVLAQRLCRVRVSDPMSGFFALRQEVFQQVAQNIRPRGFKILLEILAFLPKETRIQEAPLIFLERTNGVSKLRFRVKMAYLLQVARLLYLRMAHQIIGLIVITIILVLIGLYAW